jgi:hypothetical protein
MVACVEALGRSASTIGPTPVRRHGGGTATGRVSQSVGRCGRRLSESWPPRKARPATHRRQRIRRQR